jgi:hypothetical protein
MLHRGLKASAGAQSIDNRREHISRREILDVPEIVGATDHVNSDQGATSQTWPEAKQSSPSAPRAIPSILA